MSNVALDALVDVRRSEWGGKPRPRALTPVAEHPRIEVHHSAAPDHYRRDPLVVAAEIERYHLGLGWNGAFYGLLIALDGRIVELRGIGWRSIGAHRARYDDGTPVDPQALCVLLPGDYRTQRPTAAQRSSLDRLRAAAPDPILWWHGQRDATACPGTHAIQMCRDLNAHPPTVEDDMAKTPIQHLGKINLPGGGREWWIIYEETAVPISETDAAFWHYEAKIPVLPDAVVPAVLRSKAKGVPAG